MPREALRLSLNVPAVTVLERSARDALRCGCRRAGAEVALPEGFQPTLAMGLGGFGTRLVDLALALFGAGAGRPGRGAVGAGAPAAAGAPDVAPRRGRRGGDARRDAPAQERAAASLIAYKTGTSYGHRDAWAVGFDARHVVAVWVGRPDGTPVPQLTGWTDGFAPLLFDAFARIGVTPRPPAPHAAANAELPPPLRTFVPRRTASSPHRGGAIAIAFPPEGAVIDLTQPDGSRAPLVARVLGRLADTWLLNGRPLAVRANRRRAEIAVSEGAHTLTVVTADGASERVSFRVE
ncbi:MAG: hypothetical protein AcusKO_16600 [Acuticoccus sp.]